MYLKLFLSISVFCLTGEMFQFMCELSSLLAVVRKLEYFRAIIILLTILYNRVKMSYITTDWSSNVFNICLHISVIVAIVSRNCRAVVKYWPSALNKSFSFNIQISLFRFADNCEFALVQWHSFSKCVVNLRLNGKKQPEPNTYKSDKSSQNQQFLSLKPTSGIENTD